MLSSRRFTLALVAPALGFVACGRMLGLSEAQPGLADGGLDGGAVGDASPSTNVDASAASDADAGPIRATFRASYGEPGFQGMCGSVAFPTTTCGLGAHLWCRSHSPRWQSGRVIDYNADAITIECFADTPVMTLPPTTPCATDDPIGVGCVSQGDAKCKGLGLAGGIGIGGTAADGAITVVCFPNSIAVRGPSVSDSSFNCNPVASITTCVGETDRNCVALDGGFASGIGPVEYGGGAAEFLCFR
jgi:hypothetical protein